MSRVRAPDLSTRQTSSPSMTGSIRSRTIRSGRVVCARRSPSCPSVAEFTSNPSLRRLYVSTSTSARSSSMIRMVGLDIDRSTKSTSDIVFGLLLPGPREQLRRFVHLDHPPLKKEREVIAEPRRLLHVVGDDHN